MLLQKRLFASGTWRVVIWCAIGLLFLLALIIRISLYHVQTSDYTFFVSQWYDFIQTHGGFAAFKYNFSNYNVPYLYLLALTTYLPIPKLIAIKTLSIIFDGVLALFSYLLIRLKYKRGYVAIIGALVVVFAPTILINSAAWGQCDALYAACCLGSFYFLLRERPAWACVCFALALSFKLQAIFFLPVLLVLWLRRRLALKYLALIPLVFLLLLVPAFIAGRDVQSLLTIYVGQATTGGVGGGGQFAGGNGTGRFNGGNIRRLPGGSVAGSANGGGSGQFPRGETGQFPYGGGSGRFKGGGGGQFSAGGGRGNLSSSSLTLNAPSFYQWLPADAATYWKWIGIALAAAFVIFVGVLVAKSKQLLTPAILLKIALAFVLAIPFLLPEMHERYFYLADIFSIIAAFYFPRLLFVAIVVQLSSLLSYAPYFLHTQVVDLTYVAFAELAMVIVVTIDLALTLYPDTSSGEPVAVVAGDDAVGVDAG